MDVGLGVERRRYVEGENCGDEAYCGCDKMHHVHLGIITVFACIWDPYWLTWVHAAGQQLERNDLESLKQRWVPTRTYMDSRIRYVVNSVLKEIVCLYANVIRVGRFQNFWLSSSGMEMCARVMRSLPEADYNEGSVNESSAQDNALYSSCSRHSASLDLTIE